MSHPRVEELSFISMVQQLANSVVVDGGSVVGVDSLLKHIESSGLNLEKVGSSNTAGNCWYYSVFELCQLQGVVLPVGVKTPHDLRLAIVDSLQTHPSYSGTAETTETDLLWFRDVWGSQKSRVDKFKKTHKADGQYTDNTGIIIFATQNLLKINLKIVSTSCNKEHPITVYNYVGEGEAVADLHIGYYQDESHRGGPGGHYHGLQERPELEVAQLLPSAANKIQELENELTKMKNKPEELLKVLVKIEKTEVGQDEIINSNLAGLLMENIRPQYGVATRQGRITRRYCGFSSSSSFPSPSYSFC